MTATPALDAIAAEARALLASRWDVIPADTPSTPYLRVRVAEAAALSASGIVSPSPSESTTDLSGGAEDLEEQVW